MHRDPCLSQALRWSMTPVYPDFEYFFLFKCMLEIRNLLIVGTDAQCLVFFTSGHHSSIAILLFCRPESIPVQVFKHIFIVTAKTIL